ncbi:hypothetical protein LINGRAHAP2_LOCUS35933, partial [Linum grandiflorum]
EGTDSYKRRYIAAGAKAVNRSELILLGDFDGFLPVWSIASLVSVRYGLCPLLLRFFSSWMNISPFGLR